jgi:putative addiction module component (TIGR02574 family)
MMQEKEGPMTRPADPVTEAALRLPESERADLAARLIDSLDPTRDDDVESAWDREVLGRLDDLDQGRVRPVSWAEARQRIADDSDASEPG